MELVERQVLRRKGPLWREIMSTDQQLLRQCEDQGLLSSTEVKNIKVIIFYFTCIVWYVTAAHDYIPAFKIFVLGH